MADRRTEGGRRRSRFWLWTLFVTSLALMALGKPVYDLHWRNQATIWKQSFQKEQGERATVRADIQMRLLWVRGERPRRTERIFGLPHGYLGVVPVDRRATVLVLGEAVGPSREATGGDLFSNPGASATGWTIELDFRDGQVVAGRALAPLPSMPPDPSWWNATDLAVRLLILIGPLAWLGGLLAGLIERTRGTAAGEVALAGALAGAVAWTVQPGVLTALTGWVGIALGGAMIAAAMAMIRWLRRIARSRQLHFCYQCGYDLTGNVSGFCPECGNATLERAIRERSEQAEATALAIAAGVIAEEGVAEDDGEGAVTDECDASLDPANRMAGAAYLEEAVTASSAADTGKA